MSDNTSEQYELEQVGSLWQRIHSTEYELYQVKEIKLDGELEVTFKFKKRE